MYPKLLIPYSQTIYLANLVAFLRSEVAPEKEKIKKKIKKIKKK